jgi:hypothetical protein
MFAYHDTPRRRGTTAALLTGDPVLKGAKPLGDKLDRKLPNAEMYPFAIGSSSVKSKTSFPFIAAERARDRMEETNFVDLTNEKGASLYYFAPETITPP